MAPELRESVSNAAFRLIDDTVEQVLSRKQLCWLTAGLLLTLWELSAATRVAMTAMDGVYGFHRRRSLLELLPRSLALYGAYVASYESLFGHLATVFVLLVYVYLVANAFLAGIQLDANVRQRA